MKILHAVEFYAPSVGGMQEVVKQLSERLVRLGHEVAVATTRLPQRLENTINGVRIEEFDVSGKLATGMTGEIERYRSFVLESGFDVITNFAAQQWTTDAVITVLDQVKAKKVFVPTGFSQLHHPRFKGYFESMRGWLKQYDMNVFLSDDYQDINFARAAGAENVLLIPNGAAEDEFLAPDEMDLRGQLGIPRDHFLVLHVGSHTGLKGHREAIRIFAKARLEKATFLMIANDFGSGCSKTCRLRELLFNALPLRKKDDKRVMLASLTRAETVAAYKAADVFLFPSNIECSPLVLFEAAASRTPFLATDAGNAREIAAWTGGGAILPTRRNRKGYSVAEIDASAAMLAELWRDRDARIEMAESGFRSWSERFTWDGIARQYQHLYATLLQGDEVSL